MLPWLPAVGKDAGIVATSVFECVRKDRQAVESPLIIDSPGEFGDSSSSPQRIDPHCLKRVAEKTPYQGGVSGGHDRLRG
jgi:hypothetical protein